MEPSQLEIDKQVIKIFSEASKELRAIFFLALER
jgi:hypothetical protein